MFKMFEEFEEFSGFTVTVSFELNLEFDA